MSTSAPQTFAQLLQQRAQAQGDFRFLTFVDEASGQTETRTFDQLLENAGRLASYLQDKGFKPGDRFGVLLANHPEIVEALAAASLFGAVMVPIDPRTKGQKLAFILGDSQCRGVICGDYNRDNVEQVRGDTPIEWQLCLGQQYDDAVMSLPVHAGNPEVSAMTPMQVLYTSGTTGDPKGITKYNAELVTVAGALPMVMGIQPDDVLADCRSPTATPRCSPWEPLSVRWLRLCLAGSSPNRGCGRPSASTAVPCLPYWGV